MEFRGIEICSLKDVEKILSDNKLMRDALDSLDEIPKKINELMARKLENISIVQEFMAVVKSLSNVASKDNLLLITKQLFPTHCNTDAETEYMLKVNKKTVKNKAKELAKESKDLINTISIFCDNIISGDVEEAKNKAIKVVSKVKDVVLNADYKKQGKVLARNLGLSIGLTLLASFFLGFPLVSIETSAITGGGSVAVTTATKKLQKKKV